MDEDASIHFWNFSEKARPQESYYVMKEQKAGEIKFLPWFL